MKHYPLSFWLSIVLMTIAQLVTVFLVIYVSEYARTVLLALIILTFVVQPIYMATMLFRYRKYGRLLPASFFLFIPIWLVWLIVSV